MRVVVCVKWVPDLLRFDASSLTLDRTGSGGLNRFDANALEEALRLTDDKDEVVVISMGPPEAMEALRRGLAMGAHRSLLITDKEAAGADLVATSRALAAALERERPDCVLFGQQASDSDGSILGAAVADRLRWPIVSQVSELSLANGLARAKRQTEFGYDVIESGLPVVISVSDAINEPRYPSLKGILTAKSKPVETVTLANLGIEPGDAGEAGSRTTVIAIAPTPPRTNGRRIDGESDVAAAIVEFLAEKRMV